MSSFNRIPTHAVKVLQSDYNNNPSNITINVIGSKRPALPNGLGYDVLCEDGVYRYMSVMFNEIEVIGTWKAKEVENAD